MPNFRISDTNPILEFDLEDVELIEVKDIEWRNKAKLLLRNCCYILAGIFISFSLLLMIGGIAGIIDDSPAWMGVFWVTFMSALVIFIFAITLLEPSIEMKLIKIYFRSGRKKTFKCSNRTLKELQKSMENIQISI